MGDMTRRPGRRAWVKWLVVGAAVAGGLYVLAFVAIAASLSFYGI
jgi:hypothetical protein